MKLIDEFRRRHVFRVALGYVIAAWLVLQVTDVIMGLLELPTWIGRLVFWITLLGFPLAIAFSWAFQLTPSGLIRDRDLDPDQGAQAGFGRRLDRAIIVLLVVALGYFVVDKFVIPRGDDSTAIDRPAWYDRSVAVLPFATRGAESEAKLLASGVHDDLLTQLARIADLHVISRTSVMGYVGTERKIPEIGAELGVRHILEGGVQQAGDRVRINAQLIDAETDTHLWAETFEVELTVDSLFEVQSDIVKRISSSLHATLRPETERVIDTVPTRSLEAYRDYQSARLGGFNRSVKEDLLESAVDKDPQFALAWVELAMARQGFYWFDPTNEAALDSAEAALERAEAIRPDLPELHVARAMIRYHGYLDYDGALRELAQAEQESPGNVNVYSIRALVQRHMGRVEEAIATFRRARQYDPLASGVLFELGVTYSMGRFYDAARETWAAAIELEPGLSPQLRYMLATEDWAQYGSSRSQIEILESPDWPRFEYHAALVALKYWQDGNLERALEYARQVDPEQQREVNVAGAHGVRLSRFQAELIKAAVLQAAGLPNEAEPILASAEQRLAAKLSDQASPYWRDLSRLAWILAVKGEKARAMTMVDRMVSAFDEPHRTYRTQAFHWDHAVLKCQLEALSVAETEFAWLLSRPAQFTVASLVNYWPPCREKFTGTEHHRRLKDEFGHLARGREPDH